MLRKNKDRELFDARQNPGSKRHSLTRHRGTGAFLKNTFCRLRVTLVTLFVVSCLLFMPKAVWASDNKDITYTADVKADSGVSHEDNISETPNEIYIAGAPDAWPLEYYDRQAGVYKGVWTELLQMLADNSGIQIRYIEPSLEDQRLSLAKKMQVDAVTVIGLNSDALADAGLDASKRGLTFYDEHGKLMNVSLAYTESMPISVREALENQLIDIDESQLSALFMKYSGKTAGPNRFTTIFFCISAIMMAAAVWLLILFVRKRHQLLRTLYVDEVTLTDNFQSWKKKYAAQITNENCQHYAVLYMYTGIENISRIYGLREASRALQLIAGACAGAIKEPEGVYSRFNEFNFVMYIQYTSVESIKDRLKQIYNMIFEELKAQNKKYFLELHTGIYCLTNIDTDPLRAVQFSEVTMEYARTNTLDCSVYSELIEQKTIAGYAMEHEVIHGMIHREFVMYLQPMVRLKDGSVCGAEALVRWRHPNRGLLMPDEFMGIVKRKQLTGKMNMEIFDQGCRLLKQQKSLGRVMTMVFNFTVENVGDHQFAKNLYDNVIRYGLEPEQMIIQLNQVVEISRSRAYMQTLKELADNGFAVYLAGLELDRVFFDYLECHIKGVKLRRELIKQVEHPEGRKVVEGIVNFCHDLGLHVLCTGIENEIQAEFLKKLDCELASGYYFYYPLSLEAFEQAVEERMKEKE